METAKVDIAKLQLLSDRINEAIDALNQVRLSVHGLQHTTGVFGVPPSIGYPPFVQSPVVQTPMVPSPMVPSLSHSTLGVIDPRINPWLSSVIPMGPSHTTLGGSLWNDPWWLSRVHQTFPYVMSPTPGTLY